MTATITTMISEDYIWVDTDAQLAEYCLLWSQSSALAVDTEFMRSSTFYPIVGLLQINDGEKNYLIDPLEITDTQPLQQLWQNTAVIKVLHSCSEDLDVFNTWLGGVPTPIFDTQVAAAFAGFGFSMGYGNLVKASLGVTLEKGETRSDWLQRPLSQSQKHYAALDVAYLLVVYGKLKLELKSRDRLDWARADCERILHNYNNPGGFDQAYLKVRSAWKLRPPQLAVLQQLCHWREEQARLRDVPRNRLIKDEGLLQIASNRPKGFKALAALNSLPPRVLREDGEQLLNLLAEVESEKVALPAALEKPLSIEETALLKSLKQTARAVAEEKDIPVELLITKKDYEALVRSVSKGAAVLPKKLEGWRKQELGQTLLEAIDQYE